MEERITETKRPRNNSHSIITQILVNALQYFPSFPLSHPLRAHITMTRQRSAMASSTSRSVSSMTQSSSVVLGLWSWFRAEKRTKLHSASARKSAKSLRRPTHKRLLSRAFWAALLLLLLLLSLLLSLLPSAFAAGATTVPSPALFALVSG